MTKRFLKLAGAAACGVTASAVVVIALLGRTFSGRIAFMAAGVATGAIILAKQSVMPERKSDQ